MPSLILVFVVIAGCSASPELDPGQAGGNPLVPEVATYPFPSDYFLAEGETATGRRVAVPAELLPDNFDPAVVAHIDGFSRMTPVATFLPGGFDPSSLPAAGAASLAPDSAVLVLDAESGEPVPILAELDLTEPIAEQRALIVRPLRLLAANRGYVVVLRRGLRTASGAEHRVAPAFAALRGDADTGVADLDRQRDDFELVWSALERAGIDEDEVLLAWSFHTRSEEQVVGDLLAIQEQAAQWALQGYTIEDDEIEELEAGLSNRQLVGTFEVPNYIGADGRLSRDSSGMPVADGTREAELRLTIPSTADGSLPALVYGHGFFGGPSEATRGATNQTARTRGFATVATHIGFNNRNRADTARALTDVSELPAVVADIQQNMVNQTVLARLARAELATDFGEIGTGPTVYMGASNGSTFGTLATVSSGEFDRAVLLVGGGGLIHFLERAVQWNEFGPLVDVVFPESRERQSAFALLQLILDPIDCINYVEHLVDDRYPGNSMSVMKIMAVGDSQVRNLVSEWVARTADLPLVQPSPVSVWGLREVDAGSVADEPGALFIYDEGVEAAPDGNRPPAEDNGTHGTVRKLPSLQDQVGHFIVTGELNQACDGPCDPN